MGVEGTATFDIAGGSDANSLVGRIGATATGIGTATVSGAGSTWNTTNQLEVGNFGQGTLLIESGGSVTAGTSVFIGAEATGVGIVTVDGAGSSLGATFFALVGQSGQGTVNVTNGGDFTSNSGTLGANAGSSGTVTVDGVGSTWTIGGGGLSVASSGQGTLTIQNGGVVSSGSTIRFGEDTTGVGSAVVTGAGSSLTAVTSIVVGHVGTGTLTISNQGQATSAAGVLGNFGGSSGTVTVTGAGSAWTVTNALTVGSEGQGNLLVQNGAALSVANLTLLGDQAGSQGSVTITGAGSTFTTNDLTIGNGGTGALTIANGGAVTVNAGTVSLAGGAAAGTLNIGNGGSAGTLNATSVVFSAAGILNFNHTETNYTFAPGMSGNGTVNHLAGVTTLTGNSATFTGTTNVSGGSLYVNGMLDGTVNVAGGTLGGNGTLTGALTIGSGGTVAPGNSVGTLNVASQTFNAGSTYTVELNDGGNTPGVNNDLINATGTVTINGGTVHVTSENGTDTGTTYVVGTVYTIVTAAGGVTGAFTTLTDNYAYLNFALSYDANNVFLTSQLAATSFCLPGMTGNQCAAGKGAFSLGAGTLYTAVLNLSNAEAPGALNQLSGEIHSSAKTALIEDSHFVRDAALNRIRSAFESVAASSMPIFAYAPGGPQPAPASTDRFAIWGQAFGGFGHIKSDGNAAKLDRNSGGLLIGGDGQVAEHWRLGAFGGYGRSKFDADARNSSGSSDNYHAGIYGGSEWGAFGLRYGGAYTWHDIDSTRSIAFTGFSDRLAGSYRAGTAQVFGEVGYRLGAGGVRYEPFANLAYVNLRTNGFSEAGGAAALVAPDQSTGTTFSTLGLRAETTLVTGQSQTTLRGVLGWRHAFGDVAPTSTMTFAAGGSAFTTAGVPIAQDVLVLDAGFDVTLTPTTILGFSYGGQFGSGVTDQSVKGNLAVKF